MHAEGIRRLVLLLALPAFAGCSTARLYEGPERPRSEVAVIVEDLDTWGLAPLDAGSATILVADGQPLQNRGSNKLEVLPGEHVLEVEGDIRQGQYVFEHPHGTLRFTAVAGAEYELVPVLFDATGHVPAAIVLVDTATGKPVADTVPAPQVAVTAELAFDGRSWDITDWARQRNLAWVIWRPAGQTKDDWQEMVEVQTYVHGSGGWFESDDPLQRHVEGMAEQWADRDPPVSHVERPRSDGTRLLEWHAEAGPDGPAEHGITLLRLQDGRIHVLVYGARSRTTLAANLERWVAAFAAAPLMFPEW